MALYIIVYHPCYFVYRWRIVVHGGVDGFSRLITFLECSNNNRSETVLRAFQGGIHNYGMPERVRSDRGGENVQVSTCVY